MTPFSPRSWSDRRLVVGLGMLAVGAALAGVLGDNMLAAVMFIPAYAALDWLLMTIASTAQPLTGSVEVDIRPPVKQEALLAGSMLKMTVRLQLSGRSRGVLVVPILPPGVVETKPGGAIGRAGGGRTSECTFQFTTTQAGELVFAGVLVRVSSPLRLFSSAGLLTDRAVVTILPDYLSRASSVSARHLRMLHEAPAARRHVIRGLGSDFHELREYRPGDARRRVDWKASARKRVLMVREYEEPRQYAIQVILDTSIDMTNNVGLRAGYANAADFIARLAFIAQGQSIGFRLITYDEHSVHTHRMGSGIHGYIRLMTELVRVPRRSLLRAIGRGGAAAKQKLVDRTWRRATRHWRASASGGTFDAFMHDYFGDNVDADDRDAMFVADFGPDFAAAASMVCDDCGSTVFADDIACGTCGESIGEGVEPRRAAAASEAIALAMRQSRGREMLCFISALEGGEAGDGIAAWLRHAAASASRSVHLVHPKLPPLRASVEPPGTLGMHPSKLHTLRDLHRLRGSAALYGFRRQLLAAGIAAHEMEDGAALDKILNELLMHEVLHP